jgi:hypothetical protein
MGWFAVAVASGSASVRPALPKGSSRRGAARAGLLQIVKRAAPGLPIPRRGGPSRYARRTRQVVGFEKRPGGSGHPEPDPSPCTSKSKQPSTISHSAIRLSIPKMRVVKSGPQSRAEQSRRAEQQSSRASGSRGRRRVRILYYCIRLPARPGAESPYACEPLRGTLRRAGSDPRGRYGSARNHAGRGEIRCVITRRVCDF